MATIKQAKSKLAPVERLLEDEYVQEQLREAVVALRDAYTRAARKRAEATDDKKLYVSLRRAATSLRDAAFAVRQTEPPPKHRVRKLMIILVAASGAAMLTRLGRQEQPEASTSPDAAAAGASAPPPSAAAPAQADAVAAS